MSARIVWFQIDIFFLLFSKYTHRPTNIKTAFVPVFVCLHFRLILIQTFVRSNVNIVTAFLFVNTNAVVKHHIL